jgi:organic hydroperoxide reductase OsmC/OhrA
MKKDHHYTSTIEWVGNLGEGTKEYRSYSRNFNIAMDGKPVIPATSDPWYRGDADRYSPEDLLVSSLSGCHMLWYLHLCAVNGVVVQQYHDRAAGVMRENEDGSGEFTAVTLRPHVVVQHADMKAKALELHEEAHRMCFIARSVNFPVSHEPTTESIES